MQISNNIQLSIIILNILWKYKYLNFEKQGFYGAKVHFGQKNEIRKTTTFKWSWPCGIFVDLQRVFDTVNHEIILEKLNYYGFRGIINFWFRCYLHDRKQKVCINGFKSETKPINDGVPQGSVLGPILFLLYINDFHECIKFSETFHFADDINLLNISDDYKTLQNNVNRYLIALHNWLLANKISLNKDKTELIYFHKPRSKLPDLKIKINGTRLFHSKKIKYLGIYISIMGNFG